jgi:hypothetical protein
MSFKDKTFDQRFQDPMWNHSERAFENVWGAYRHRFGLDQMTDNPIDSWKLDPFIRHMPDYICQVVARGEPFFVEVQGTGKDRLHKFKQGKLAELKLWNQTHDVWFWLWDDTLGIGTMISLNQINLLIAKGEATRGTFDGKRPYWAIHVDKIVKHSDWLDRIARYE